MFIGSIQNQFVTDQPSFSHTPFIEKRETFNHFVVLLSFIEYVLLTIMVPAGSHS